MKSFGNGQPETTYNDLRRAVDLPPVASFMELTGGDAELAHQLEVLYEGDVDKVGANIGILCEPRPVGGLNAHQFFAFMLSDGPALVQAANKLANQH